jgi:hypothetical protein
LSPEGHPLPPLSTLIYLDTPLDTFRHFEGMVTQGRDFHVISLHRFDFRIHFLFWLVLVF